MKKLITALFMLFCLGVYAQVNHTANDRIKPYTGVFHPGVNPGYEPPWVSKDLGDIAAGNPAKGIAGAGVKAFRGQLSDEFTSNWGIEFALKDYQYYQSLGMDEHTLIVGFPAAWHKEQEQHCPGIQSEAFANLYTPIWDGGANGTPYNDDNYLAAYMYQLVTNYKDYIHFWEIWNEPGFDYAGVGWRQPGDPVGNWWDRNPQPCEYKLRAPIFHYIRTLRICWDIIKTVDPDAYVVVAGVGYESFLDAILRNTDNPVDGSATAEYPHGGGAYFDVMGFHSYPHFDGSTAYRDNTGQLVFERTSDGAANGFVRKKEKRQAILAKYGYDGVTYPKKLWISTEMNIPRLGYKYNHPGDGWTYFGTAESQRNFVIKSFVTAMKEDLVQVHYWKMAEREPEQVADDEFDNMGLYYSIKNTPSGSTARLTDAGVAYKTGSDALYGTRYDAARTAQMNLPAGVGGGAFKRPNGEYVYCIWAITQQDLSEQASATYSFPANFGLSQVTKWDWNYSKTRSTTVSGSTNIQLTGAPVFLFGGTQSTPILTIDNCPSNISRTVALGQSGANISWTAPTASTTCPGGQAAISQVSGTPSGGLFTIGTHKIEYRIADNCGNTKTCSFQITVESEGLDGNCPKELDGFEYLGEFGGHQYFLSEDVAMFDAAKTTASAFGGYITTINSAAENAFIQSKVSQVVFIGLGDAEVEGQLRWANGEASNYDNFNICSFCQPNNANNDYVIMTPWDGQWSYSYFLSSRPYVLELPCGDDGGNTGETYELTLAECPSDINLTAAIGQSSMTVNWATPTINSTCPSGATISQIEGIASGNRFPVGTTKVSYEASDNCGNVATCSFNVTIQANNNTGTDVCSSSSLEGFTYLGSFRGNKYFVSEDNANWVDAQANAEAVGGYLAVINSAAENSFIQRNVNSIVYIGLGDRAIEGQLAWANSDPITYSNFDICSFCPENSQDNDYVIFLNWNGSWAYSHFQAVRRYLIEVPCNVAPRPAVVAENATTEAIAVTPNLEVANIFPNPANELITVDLLQGSNDINTTLNIFDATGAMVSQKVVDLTQGYNRVMIDIATLPSGMYFLNLTTGTEQTTNYKFIKL